jgi:His/Glu/Gln/Arg/opine family amino acid ABC transporter permease subunit
MANFIFGIDFSPITNHLNLFLNAAILTIVISFLAIGLGFALGVPLGLARISKWKIVKWPATLYVDVIRGTPLLVQLFIIYFGLPFIGLTLAPVVSATLAVGLHSSAYQAEILRGGIQSIPKGQTEAARATGMTHLQAMRYVILPQSLRLVIPPMTNEFIIVIKDSSLSYAIGVVELTKLGYQLNGDYFEPFLIFVFVALVYLIITFSTSTVMKQVERKFRIPGYGVHE